MTTQLSKADKIRALLHLSNDEIVRRTGERREYIRVIRQRTSKDGNPIPAPADKNYQPRKNERYATDPALRKRHYAKVVRWRVANREYYLARMREYQRKRRAEARAS